MQKGSAITIVKSSNGYIVFEQSSVKLPEDAASIATFTKLGGRYDRDLLGFIEDHFNPPVINDKEDE